MEPALSFVWPSALIHTVWFYRGHLVNFDIVHTNRHEDKQTQIFDTIPQSLSHKNHTECTSSLPSYCYLLVEGPRGDGDLDDAPEGVGVVELAAGDGAALLQADHAEPDEGGRLAAVRTLQHHRDLKGTEWGEC